MEARRSRISISAVARTLLCPAFFFFIAMTGLVSYSKKPVSDENDDDIFGGRHGIRTHDPHVANVVLSQLS